MFAGVQNGLNGKSLNTFSDSGTRCQGGGHRAEQISRGKSSVKHVQDGSAGTRKP